MCLLYICELNVCVHVCVCGCVGGCVTSPLKSLPSVLSCLYVCYFCNVVKFTQNWAILVCEVNTCCHDADFSNHRSIKGLQFRTDCSNGDCRPK